jgi:hypothetical protein
MSKKERIEDLGRLSVLLQQAIDHDIWNIKSSFCRDKEFAEVFMKQETDKQFDLLHDHAYHMSSLLDLIYAMKEIADGDEELNEEN